MGSHRQPANSPIRILLPEGSSLSAREAIAALGPQGYVIDVCDPNPLCIGRFSRFVRNFYRCPILRQDPYAYLSFLLRLLSEQHYDALMPVHEQAFLFARAAAQISRRVGLAVADFGIFERLQSKAIFIDVLDELNLPHPRTLIIHSRADLECATSFPYYIKTAYGTAGNGTWRVTNAAEQAAIISMLDQRGWLDNSEAVIVQDVAPGVLEVAQSIFSHGQLIAAHCYQQRIEGVGGSASGRVSVRRPVVREHLQQLGRHLDWHGSLMIDYLYNEHTGQVAYIDPNPRMGETMNATLSGINLAEIMVRLSLNEVPIVRNQSTVGVQSHILLAVLLGLATRGGTRRDLLREVGLALFKQGQYEHSHEECAIVREDFFSLLPLVIVLGQLLINPKQGGKIAAKAIRNYAITSEAAEQIRNLQFE